jgi:DNA-binding transcriptional MerR regulator
VSTLREERFYNLKAVIRQTALKPDTLRAWERRYGLPTPERSEGGHRLYSRRDIDIIKWLVARQHEGLTIKRAVQLWRQIEAEGRDPLQPATPILSPAPAVPTSGSRGETITHLRQEWMASCLLYDETRAEQALAQAFALYPPETVAVELLQRAVAEVGEGWYRGHVTVQQEHFCSALVVRRLEALVLSTPSPIHTGRILAACPPEEYHVISLLLLTFLLRRRGWGVVYLGANVPAEQLESTVAARRPQMVIVAAQQLHTAATLLEIDQVLQREGVILAYGGLIFNLLPQLRERITGHFLGERLDLAPQVAEALMAAPPLLQGVERVPERYLQARAGFEEQRGNIEAHLTQDLADMGLTSDYLSMANRELALNISAALTLGNMDFLGKDIEWVKGLIRNYQMPSEVLHGYLVAYHRRAREVLDERGALVVAWLEKLVDGNGSQETRR